MVVAICVMGVTAILSVPVSLLIVCRHLERTFVPAATPLAVVKEQQRQDAVRAERVAAAAEERRARAGAVAREAAFGS